MREEKKKKSIQRDLITIQVSHWGVRVIMQLQPQLIMPQLSWTASSEEKPRGRKSLESRNQGQIVSSKNFTKAAKQLNMYQANSSYLETAPGKGEIRREASSTQNPFPSFWPYCNSFHQHLGRETSSQSFYKPLRGSEYSSNSNLNSLYLNYWIGQQSQKPYSLITAHIAAWTQKNRDL